MAEAIDVDLIHLTADGAAEMGRASGQTSTRPFFTAYRTACERS